MYKFLMLSLAVGNLFLYFTQDTNKDIHLIAANFCLTMIALDNVEDKLDKILEKK